MNRCEKLVARFFDILENGGEYNEMFLIRDLLMSEYIEGRCSQVEIIQIDDLVEIEVEHFEDECEIVLDYEAETLEKEVFSALSDKDVERSIELIKAYGEISNCHVYVYYCMIRGLERITGENLVELCL